VKYALFYESADDVLSKAPAHSPLIRRACRTSTAGV
jgi:hypothetical protein